MIVIAGPVVEELVFRHIIIGELGKKFNFIVMGIVSAITFTLIHVTDAKSPFEFGAYFYSSIVSCVCLFDFREKFSGFNRFTYVK